MDQYGRWITESSEAIIVYLSESGHYMHVDDPTTALSAIRNVAFPSVERILVKSLEKNSASTAITLYRSLKLGWPRERFNERMLNRLGYRMLAANRLTDAIALFELNVAEYPKASNPYDSLGEAYMAAGNKTLAIKNYRRSLRLNPRNSNAERMLHELTRPPTKG